MKNLWIIVTVIIMTGGLAGTILPLLPGIPLIYAAFIFYGFLSGWEAYGAGAVIGWGTVTAFTVIVDFYAGSLGARRFGSSRIGIWGAFLGGVLGTIFFGFPGLIGGPFLGALAGELVTGKPVREAFRAAWGTLVGLFGSSLFKVAVGFAMIGSYLWWVLR